MAPHHPPPVPRRPRKQRPVLAAILVIAVVTALVAAAALIGRPSNGNSYPVMSYLPPSGTRVVLANATDPDEVQEWATLVGLAAVAGGPAAFLLAGADLDDITATTWVRMTAVAADAAGRVSSRSTQLFAVTPDGLELRVISSPAGFTAFSPGLPVLRAGQAEQSWSATGTVRRGPSGFKVTRTLPYHAEVASRGADRGCVAVTSRLTVAAEPVVESEQTWCPGRGVAVSRADGRGRAAVDRPPRWTGGLGVTAPASPALGGAWRFERRRLANALTYSVRPAVLANDVVAYASGTSRDIQARSLAGSEVDDPSWIAHPGGTITAMLGLGTVLVVATTDRRVVAYGAEGQFLWQAALTDVSAVPIARLDGLAVVATLDGTITAFDAASGTVAWQGSTPNEIRLPMAVDEAGVTVLDQAGNLAGFGADGTVRHSLQLDQPESFALVGDLVVVASRQDRFVRAHRLSDGSLVWRQVVPGGRAAMATAGDRVLIRQSDQVLALSAAEGRPEWTVPYPATDLVVIGDRLVLTDRTAIRLYDFAGVEQASFTTQETDLSSSPGAMITAGDQLYLFFGDHVYRKESR